VFFFLHTSFTSTHALCFNALLPSCSAFFVWWFLTAIGTWCRLYMLMHARQTAYCCWSQDFCPANYYHVCKLFQARRDSLELWIVLSYCCFFGSVFIVQGQVLHYQWLCYFIFFLSFFLSFPFRVFLDRATRSMMVLTSTATPYLFLICVSHVQWPSYQHYTPCYCIWLVLRRVDSLRFFFFTHLPSITQFIIQLVIRTRLSLSRW